MNFCPFCNAPGLRIKRHKSRAFNGPGWTGYYCPSCKGGSTASYNATFPQKDKAPIPSFVDFEEAKSRALSGFNPVGYVQIPEIGPSDVIQETAKAILIYAEGNAPEGREIWLPKSQIKVAKEGPYIYWYLPTWLYNEKSLGIHWDM